MSNKKGRNMAREFKRNPYVEQSHEINSKRVRLPSSVDREVALEELMKTISIPLSDGNLDVCIAKLREAFDRIHGDNNRDIRTDTVSIWLKDMHQNFYEEIGKEDIDTMEEFCKHSPQWYVENFRFARRPAKDGSNSGDLIKIKTAQVRWRNTLDQQDKEMAYKVADPSSPHHGLDTEEDW